MPIKVRCKACETVLNVSDQAAGKIVKCKQCGERVRVPVPNGHRPAARTRPSREEDAQSTPRDALENLDLRSAEDTKRRVCPGCARPVDLDAVECPKCGVTIATGALSERQRIRYERKGPPPEEFYGAIWSNGWKFLKKHWGYGVRTAMIWSMTLSMSLTCLYSLGYYVRVRTAELQASADADKTNIKIDGNVLTLTVPKEKGSKAVYDGTYYTVAGSVIKLNAPHVQPWFEPPSAFWIFLTVVFQLGFGGWAWTLAITITKLTMSGEKRIKRFPMDFFGNLTIGFRFYVWPTVLLMPFLWISGVLGLLNQHIASGIVTAVLMLIPLLVLPAAVIHMTQNYHYRGWLLWWMARDFFKTFGPSMYIFMLNLFMVFLVPLGVVITMIVAGRQIIAWLMTQEAAFLVWTKANIMDMGEGNFQFLFYQMPLVFTFCFLVFFIICGLMSFPAVFMMRVVGLYGVYFKPDLSLVNEFPDLETAGFGPRFLAFMIDLVIVTLLGLVGIFIGTLFGLLFSFYGWGAAAFLQLGVQIIASLMLTGFYFASMEAGASRATLGKASIGLMALRDDNMPMTRQQAFGRAGSAFVTFLTFYLGFLLCFFRADKKALHDLMSKSKVVWRGEEL